MNKTSLIIIAIALMAALFLGASYMYNSQQTQQKTDLATQHNNALIKFHSPRLGNPNAKVTIVEFMDPACEACRQFHPFVKNLMKKYKNKINVVIRYAPYHQGSDYAVKILEAAKKQGVFLDVLELMYAAQPAWAAHHSPQPELLWQYLEHYKFDVARLKQDMNDPAISKIIEEDLADAKLLGANKTPTFFVNGKPLPSFGFEQLETLVRSEIAANY